MEELGIPCKIITGTYPDISSGTSMTMEEYEKYINTWVPCSETKSVGHAWNVVELDGNWYHIDATQTKYLNTNEKVPTPFESEGGLLCEKW